MTALERYGIEAVICLLLVFGIVTYLEHRGAAKYEAADAKLVQEQVVKNQQQEAKDTQAINQEALTHEQAITAPVLPTPALVCVRVSPARPLLPATAAEPLGNGPTVVPATTGPSFDPAPAVAKVGQAADAQIIELQSYVRDVCLAKAPQ